MLGVQVKLWDPLRMCAIPGHLRSVSTFTFSPLPYLYYHHYHHHETYLPYLGTLQGVFTIRHYTNPRLPLPYLYYHHYHRHETYLPHLGALQVCSQWGTNALYKSKFTFTLPLQSSLSSSWDLPVTEEEVENDDSQSCYASRYLIPRIITSAHSGWRGRGCSCCCWWWWRWCGWCCGRSWIKTHVSITAVYQWRGAVISAAVLYRVNEQSSQVPPPRVDTKSQTQAIHRHTENTMQQQLQLLLHYHCCCYCYYYY